MTCLRYLLILLASAALYAVVCPAESSDEMKHLTEGFAYLNLYCPRCGRSMHFDGKQYQIKDAGNYSALVDRFAGTCNPHPWEHVSSMSTKIENNVARTNKNRNIERLSNVRSFTCSDGMRNFVRGFVERVAPNSQFIQVITYIGETNQAEGKEVMNWFCSVPEVFTTNADVLIRYLVEPTLKEQAASDLINIIGNGRPDLTSQAYVAWKQKYLYMKKEPQPTNSPFSSPAAGLKR